jgi:iron complex transport system permease protein
MLTAILAGASLSVAGLMMQTLFRNPLAGPYILGVSSGASLGVALVTMVTTILPLAFSLSPHSLIATSAIIGSMLTMMLVMLFAKRIRNNVTLLIVGMMVGNIAGALVNMIQNFANPDSLKLFIVWTLGSLSGVSWDELPILTIGIVLAAILVLMLIKPLNGLLLGEDYARGLGIHVERTRWMMVLASCLLAGSVTAFCGPIAFIGVAVPHIARGIFATSNHRLTVPASALIGANILLVCDILCNLGTYSLPISTMSALFGAPIILWIVLKKK